MRRVKKKNKSTIIQSKLKNENVVKIYIKSGLAVNMSIIFIKGLSKLSYSGIYVQWEGRNILGRKCGQKINKNKKTKNHNSPLLFYQKNHPYPLQLSHKLIINPSLIVLLLRAVVTVQHSYSPNIKNKITL